MTTYLLQETGDALLLESGDNLLTEETSIVENSVSVIDKVLERDSLIKSAIFVKAINDIILQKESKNIAFGILTKEIVELSDNISIRKFSSLSTSLSDSVKIRDTFSIGKFSDLRLSFSEKIFIRESRQIGVGYSLSNIETIILSENNLAFSRNYFVNKFDTVDLVENSLSNSAIFDVFKSDVISLREFLSISQEDASEPSVTNTEIVFAKDITNRSAGLLKAQSDIVHVSDHFILSLLAARSALEVVRISDSLNNSVGLFRQDIVTISETVSIDTSFDRALSDRVELSENISFTKMKSLSDIVLLKELVSLSSIFNKSQTEGVVIKEFFSITSRTFGTLTEAITDEITISDTNLRQIARIIRDIVMMSDTLKTAKSHGKADMVRLADLLIKFTAFAKSKADSVVLRESIKMAVSKGIIDRVKIEDLIYKVLNKINREVILLNETFRISHPDRYLYDRVFLRERVSVSSNLNKISSDKVLVADIAQISVLKEFFEIIEVSDTIFYNLHKTIFDRLKIKDTLNIDFFEGNLRLLIIEIEEVDSKIATLTEIGRLVASVVEVDPEDVATIEDISGLLGDVEEV